MTAVKALMLPAIKTRILSPFSKKFGRDDLLREEHQLYHLSEVQPGGWEKEEKKPGEKNGEKNLCRLIERNKTLIQTTNTLNKMAVGIPSVSGGRKCCQVSDSFGDPISFQGKSHSQVVCHCLPQCSESATLDLLDSLPSKHGPGPVLLSF